MGVVANVVDETALPAFRDTRLSARALYARLPTDGGVLQVSPPPGVGKTFAAHGLVGHALAREHDLVVYIAPTRALIAELLESPAITPIRHEMVVLERRPTARCGALNTEWSDLEKAGCAALAKSSLCEICAARGDCGWPNQFDRINKSTRLVVCTESYVGLNPGLIRRVVDAAEAARPLVIFDEASFLTTSQRRGVTLKDIERFSHAVADAHRTLGSQGEPLLGVLEALQHLLDGKEDLATWPRISRFDFLGATVAIQSAGRNRYGPNFQYVGPQLIQLMSAANAARWYSDGAYHFVPVPDTKGCHVVVFSPYMPPQIIEERLQRPVIQGLSPTVFRHSGTKVINIADPVGALRTLSSADHFTRVADLFTALVMRDRLLGRRPVLVIKKALLGQLKRHVEELTAALGRPLICRTLGEISAADDGGEPDVTLLSYGVLGVNTLKDHDALYCVGGFYARQAQLDETYNQLLPPEDRIDLMIRTEAGRRRVVAGSPDSRSRYHARRAQAVLEMIERRVVLQALGRVRPFTSPATLIVFQQDDLADVLGDVETFSRLSHARTTLKIPPRAEILRAALGDQLRPDQSDGLSYRAIATKHELPLSTVYKALASPPLDDLLRGIQL
jgi:hypothetical protein